MMLSRAKPPTPPCADHGTTIIPSAHAQARSAAGGPRGATKGARAPSPAATGRLARSPSWRNEKSPSLECVALLRSRLAGGGHDRVVQRAGRRRQLLHPPGDVVNGINFLNHVELHAYRKWIYIAES